MANQVNLMPANIRLMNPDGTLTVDGRRLFERILIRIGGIESPTLTDVDDLLGETRSSYATLANPTFTGTPKAPTATADTNTTQLATTAYVLGQASDDLPLINGMAVPGTSYRWARSNHVHPTDSTRAPIDSPTFTGAPYAPTPAVDNNTQRIATTAWYVNQKGTATPAMNGTASDGVSYRFASQDHVHPHDTTKQDVIVAGTVTGARGGNVALTSLLTALAASGLIVNSTTP